MLLPGGIAEMLEIGTETEEVVFLKTRKGFIRFAIKEGLDLVPGKERNTHTTHTYAHTHTYIRTHTYIHTPHTCM